MLSMLAMGAIQVKNVPSDLHDGLRRRAADEGVDLQDYVLQALRRDVAAGATPPPPTSRPPRTCSPANEPRVAIVLDGSALVEVVLRSPRGTDLAPARALDAPLVTLDSPMARAPVRGVRIVVP